MTTAQSAEKAIREALAAGPKAIATDLYGDRYMQGPFSRADLSSAQDALVTAANPAALTALLDELERLRRDAERYRYLRNEAWGCGKSKRTDVHVCQLGPGVSLSSVTELAEEALDTAIDAAMKENRA